MPAKEPVPYIIIFEGRNGSSHLVSMLNGHPGTICYPEIMPSLDAPDQCAAILTVSAGAGLHLLCGFAAADFYFPDGFQKKWEMRPFLATGFKTKVSDFKNIVSAIQQLEQENYMLIYLQRGNPLRAVLSLINGKELEKNTGDWNVRDPQYVQGQFTVDLDEFRQQLEHRILVESLHRWFYTAFKGPKISALYEDLVKDEEAFLARILEFLELPPLERKPRGAFVKLMPESLRAAVLNYDDLVHAYRNTEFARFL
jgi:hypothetical protein